MSTRPFTIGERLFRAAVIAIVGAVAGLVVGLVLARRTWPGTEDTSLVVPLTVVGTGLGAVLGFLLGDYAWKRVLRVLMPFGRWP